MTKLSTIDAAEKVLLKAGKELSFSELWEEIVEVLEYNEKQAADRIAKFYSELSLSPKFVGLDDNHWDLRERRTIDEAIVDTSDILLEEDEEDLELIEYDSNFGNDEF